MSGVAEQPAAAKGDPQDFVFRGRPAPVVRFKRSLLVGGAGAIGAAFLILAWVSLDPPSLARPPADDSAEPSNGPSPEMLASAPATYDKVPRLGPPLPGDLGPPILAQERAVRSEDGAAAPAAEAAAEAEERQRRQAELRSALASGVLSKVEGPRAAAAASSGDAAVAPVTGPPPGGEAAGEAAAGQAGVPSSPWLLSAGTIIPASLVTALDSDAPGTVVAQVTRDVRDSATGTVVLVPRGARLVGSYDSRVGFRQKRLTVRWDRLVFPGGSSVSLGNMPATDASGFAGLEDKVNFHEGGLVKAVLMSAILGAAGNAGMGSGPAAAAAALGGGAREAAQAGGSIVSRSLDVQPTLQVRAGWPVRAIVTEEIHLMPWRNDAD